MHRLSVACATSCCIFTSLLAGACARDDAAGTPGGLATVPLDSESYPCSIRFEPTGVVLRSDVAGSVPDPGARVDVFPDGRFVTSTPGGGSVLVWSAEGDFLKRIGREGSGPGEMGPAAEPRVGADGNLHTFSQSRWSRFTPDGTFLSSGTSPYFRSGTFFVAILGPDSLLTVYAPEPREHTFYVVDGSGRLLRSFGDRPKAPQEQRTIAMTDPGTVWIGPVYGSSDYFLEEWSLDGRLIRRIDREAEWLSRIIDQGPSLAGSSSGEPRYPLAVRLDAGANGLLMVSAFNQGPNDPGGTAYLEVIDPDGPTVLASKTLDREVEPAPFFLTHPAPNTAYRLIRDELDVPSIQMLRYHLDPAPGASRADAALCTL